MRCRLCGHQNPDKTERCERCAAWLVQSADVGGVVPAPGAPSAAGPEALSVQVMELIAAGRKIEAIRVYREATGCGLLEAKNAVEAIEAGRQWPEQPVPDADEPELNREVLDLVRGGNLIAAIKRYREATGRGLKESKDAVETLARRHGVGVPPAKGCGTAVLLAIVPLLMFVALLMFALGQ